MLDDNHALLTFRCARSAPIVSVRHRFSCRSALSPIFVCIFGACIAQQNTYVKTLASHTAGDLQAWSPQRATSRHLPCVPQRGQLLHSPFVNSKAYWSAGKVFGHRSWMSALGRSCWRSRRSMKLAPMRRCMQIRYLRV